MFLNFLKIFNNTKILILGDDDVDNDTPPEDPLSSSSKNRHNRGSIVRLKKRDIPLYGYCPETDPFAIVTCRHCRMVLKAAALKRHIDLRHEPMVKIEKMNLEKISGGVEKISVVPSSSEKTESKRHRHVQRKSTPVEESVKIEAAPIKIVTPPPPPFVPQITVVPSSGSSSASNSPQPRRKKRKQQLEPVITQEPTFQTIATPVPPQPCRIIMSSSPPPLAPITQEAPPSVWIVTPSPAVIIDGSFVVKPLEAEIDTEIDLKDLKILKPAVKEQQSESQTQLTSSNWYATQPRPLTLNTFNMRKISAQRYVMATQRKLIELGRTLRQDDKISATVTKPQPKTWSFIERSQVFIPFRVTH